MTDNSEFGLTPIAQKGIDDEVSRLVEEGMTESEALRVAATTLDGAGDDPDGTVDSVQTCTDIEGRPVPGLTSSDSAEERTDEFAVSAEDRLRAAEEERDEAAEWLRKNDPRYLGKSKNK